MYAWLYRQLNAGTRRSSAAALSVGRSRKLKQLSSKLAGHEQSFCFLNALKCLNKQGASNKVHFARGPGTH